MSDCYIQAVLTPWRARQAAAVDSDPAAIPTDIPAVDISKAEANGRITEGAVTSELAQPDLEAPAESELHQGETGPQTGQIDSVEDATAKKQNVASGRAQARYGLRSRGTAKARAQPESGTQKESKVFLPSASADKHHLYCWTWRHLGYNQDFHLHASTCPRFLVTCRCQRDRPGPSGALLAAVETRPSHPTTIMSPLLSSL